MSRTIRRSGWWLSVLAFCLSCGAPPRQPDTPGLDQQREQAYRANNRGVALLEQFAYDRAFAAFEEALALDPTQRLARINLPIALFYAGRTQEAASAATAAHDRYPDAPQPIYMTALIARAEQRLADAVAGFRRVLALDSDDVGAKVNLALAYVQQRQYAQAAELCASALAFEPYNATAAYNLAVALTRTGNRAAGSQAMRRFQTLRTAPYAITYSQAYLEQGRYAEALASSGAEPDLVSFKDRAAVFTDATDSVLDARLAQPGAATQRPGPLGGGITLSDLDGDGDLDVIVAGPAFRALTNERSHFVDRTAEIGLTGIGDTATAAVAGDVDNNGLVDLLILTMTGPRLFAQRGDGRFGENDNKVVTRRGVARTAAFVDIDHDGDLDILIGGLNEAPAPPASGWRFLKSGRPVESRLVRNNGNGTFEDVTASAGLGGLSAVVAVAPTDFDNRRDIDLLATSYDARPKLFRNLRDGSFADVAGSVGLPGVGPYISVAVGDVNKDGFTDMFFGQEDAPAILALSDGRGRFRLQAGPPGTESAVAAQLFDYDNNGLLDLVVCNDDPHLYRNTGQHWADETERVTTADLRQSTRASGGVSGIAAGDLDLDGDIDVVALLRSGAIRVWRNDGGNRNKSLRVTLTGRVSNRSGIGAKVEMRAGSLYQKMETASAAPPAVPADLVFGLGTRNEADVVRVLWPAGILQAETVSTGVGTPGALAILELNRKSSSCPYLFTWNGHQFDFVTDFLGGGEMGSWTAPGERSAPDPIEYVRIGGDRLQARNGRFELRVTNELEEALFVDQLALLEVTHPADVSVFPDEGLRSTARPFRLWATRRAHPPLAATDEHGHDVLAQISKMDRRYPDDFDLLRTRGYAREHSLTLELPERGPRSSFDREVLLLTGWTDYAFSTDNVAASQAGLSLRAPILQAQESSGSWRTVDADVGVPVGRPQTIVVNVTNVTSRRVRLVTNMRIYWDQIVVADGTTAVDARRVPLRDAVLRWRGFSTLSTPDGREPFGYDYTRVQQDAQWKLMPGRYTREGDVGELIASADDRFAISRPGDELALSFDASSLLPVPANAGRTFLLRAVGYSKEMDLHSASPDAVAPIPFRGMTQYPYFWPERYPHEGDLDRFQTRIVPKSILTLQPTSESHPRIEHTHAAGR